VNPYVPTASAMITAISIAALDGEHQHLIVAAGRMRAARASDAVALGPGDYLAFPGDVAHRYEALEPGTLAVLLMDHP
jgi:quercetin dioxygenase-like cupin family protein